MARRIGGTPWAFADQALISGANFLTTVLLARSLTRGEFGDFALVYAGLLFANSLQAGPITTAHNVLGSARRGVDYVNYTTSTAFSQLVFAAALALLSILAAVVAWAAGSPVAPLLAVLSPAIFAWQLQEFSRRALYTERRLAGAFANDAVSYGGQALGIVLLGSNGLLSATGALAVLAASSAVAAGLGAFQLRGSLNGRVDTAAIRENWDFGKWLVGVQLVGNWMSNEAYFLMTGFLVDAAAAAVLRASNTVFGPTRVLAYVLNSLLPIRLSRTLADRGDLALDDELRRTCRVVIPILGGYCLLIALFAASVLRLFFGGTYAEHASVLAMYCVLMFIIYINMIIDAVLLSKRLSSRILSSQLRANLVILPIGWLAVGRFGPHGAVAAMITTNLVQGVLTWRIYRRSLPGPPVRTTIERPGGPCPPTSVAGEDAS